MERIVKSAMNATPEHVDGELFERFADAAFEASAFWARVEQVSFAAPYLQLSAGQRQELEESIVAERAALSALNRALRESDHDAILRTARGLKPPFAKIYMLLGDFRGLREPTGR